MNRTQMKIWKEFGFEAAHSLPDERIGGPNARMHGHSYKARVYVAGEIQDNHMVVHMDKMDDAIRSVRFRLDHMNLNEVFTHCDPTMERIAEFIAASFAIPGLFRVDVWRPTCGDGATWEAS